MNDYVFVYLANQVASRKGPWGESSAHHVSLGVLGVVYLGELVFFWLRTPPLPEGVRPPDVEGAGKFFGFLAKIYYFESFLTGVASVTDPHPPK